MSQLDVPHVVDAPADETEVLVETLFRAVLPELRPRIPRATYRLQLSRELPFEQARAIIDYLDALGVSDLYASPCFRAHPESLHGYDVVDHTQFNPAIGTRSDFERLTDRLSARGMGLLLDTVPNHMGIGGNNPWWRDVLENGPSSIYSSFFDIAWRPPQPALDNRVLLPVLGDHYGRVLERGELRVDREGGAFVVAYWDQRFPLSPRTYRVILEPLLPELARLLGEEHEAVLELQSILTGLDHLPPRGETRRPRMVERHREKEILKRRLAALLDGNPALAHALDERLGVLNGHVGEPRSFDEVDALLEAQAWRLSYFRVAAEEINYRRFFDINDLVALRVENPAVFAAAHQLLLELVGEGRVTGLRIDHLDGLWDPAGYLDNLQEQAVMERMRRTFLRLRGRHPGAGAGASTGTGAGAAPASGTGEIAADKLDAERFDRLRPLLRERWRAAARQAPHEMVLMLARPLYVVVEKILARGEELPEEFATWGTVGYEFGALVTSLLTDPAGEAPLSALYRQVAGERPRFDQLVYEKKKLVLQTSLAAELGVLAHALDALAEQNRHFRDFTLGTLTHALMEVIAWFPAYRTYVSEHEESVSGRDRQVIERAVRQARRRSPTVDPSVYSFLKAVLTLDLPEAHAAEKRRAREFVMKFQQLTGPVMAKGMEDTAFYLHHRLIALNDVGGAPERFGVSLDEFHAECQRRLQRDPHSLLATSTHDSKRSEDVRARIAVLAQIPEAWKRALGPLTAAAAELRRDIDGEPTPGPNEEYLFHQSVLGSFPWPAEPDEPALAEYADRLVAYMAKAAHEAKERTSWINPDAEYDAAVEDFVRRALAPGSAYLAALAPILAPVALHGMWSSLSQVLLKLTVPGVPDIYQGNELWHLRLVDPDNRRAIDYAHRRQLLDELRAARRDPRRLARELMAAPGDGRIKMYVTLVALTLRRALPELFEGGEHRPLYAGGRFAECVVAFTRAGAGEEVVVVAPRFSARVVEGRMEAPVGAAWGDTTLRLGEAGLPSRWIELLTGTRVDVSATEATSGVSLSRLLADFPLALLRREAL